LIASGTANPAFVVSKEVSIEDVPEAYREFSAHRQTKVLIRFDWSEPEEQEPKSKRQKRAHRPTIANGNAPESVADTFRGNIH
jgi:hypothetical protein